MLNQFNPGICWLFNLSFSSLNLFFRSNFVRYMDSTIKLRCTCVFSCKQIMLWLLYVFVNLWLKLNVNLVTHECLLCRFSKIWQLLVSKCFRFGLQLWFLVVLLQTSLFALSILLFTCLSLYIRLLILYILASILLIYAINNSFFLINCR
jgi:hypothetical protein